jgi:DNA-binding FrmR family transcriptional regulator
MYAIASTASDTATIDPVCFARQRYSRNKAGYIARLRRIEGQVRGVARMIDSEQYRVAILTQVSALSAALRSLGLGLVDDHMKHCVVGAVRHDPGSAEAIVQEVSESVAGLSRGISRTARTAIP